ncbi:exodeoxyribonuclease VII small subunit [Vibrio crassostreae]|jgi:exodeoxyribonuclease VII small subunit|uniref:Exodeoxyribonuclease 7 small subunit n=13 Tax=Vibrio TaxID=662 RepID=A0A1A6JCZ3_9VIBR|nr:MULTISPECIES: exodeoxyribonuclease VII small subunit [Vibrio]ANP75789.1 exodeoxyribonuclease VII small subunit [Vibrio crassostreae 9CS106]EDK29216.1 exodeoxyribonuclease VII small subunit [Vibrionales bacterium SWAT-3]MDD1822366.1 exodeoxyribonuclease VII small subunit [Photobacterium sp. ZSDE20]MDE9379438.1 exodeoxyribonuclease VII small subunit [Vibrio alginolyticus]MEC7942286.1 exodeoxyribonuclease VII small subunit [Pseudomonadota bacterium]HAH03726.1 exodeoxyribonuclease 7 small subu|tara:strand:- start:699 stop:941 length:243 start_codon:yes stop_codon:yes gene_type:complete
MATKKPENMSFEAAIEELDGLVDQLENGDLALDDALKKFERGISLARAGQSKLNDAEQRVSILLQNDENAELSDFNPQPE